MLVQQPALKVDQTNVILSCHSLSRKIMYFGCYNEQLHSLKSMLQTKSVCLGKDFREPISEPIHGVSSKHCLQRGAWFNSVLLPQLQQNQNKLSGGGIFYHSSKSSSVVSTTITVANGIAGPKLNTKIRRLTIFKLILSPIPRKELFGASNKFILFSYHNLGTI